MSIRSISGFRAISGLLILTASFALNGCCGLCQATICGEGTKVDPDGGGEIVDRDGEPAMIGGQCIPE